jgi:cell wall-associated NlpC family hydrolase
MPGADDWRDIPNGILEKDQQQTAAQDWGAQQRAELAALWGQNARDEAAMSAPGGGFDPSHLAAPPEQSAGGGAVLPQSSPPAPAQPSASGLDDVQPGLPPAPVNYGSDWLSLAQSQIGKPYIWGSAGGRSDFSPDAAGFDCSGFVSYVYKNALGINLPAQTRSAYAATKPITADAAVPGDIVEWMDEQGRPDKEHIAIYIGNGQIIQSGGTKRGVNIGSLNQFGNTYEFRRASGAESALGNAAATHVVGAQVDGPSSTAVAPSPQPSSVFDGAVQAARDAVSSATQAVSQTASDAGEAVSQAPQAVSQSFDSIVNAARQATGYVEPEASPTPTPGFGFDPSHMQPATAPQEGVPLRQDVRDLSQQPQSTVFDQAGSALAAANEHPPLEGVGQALAASPVGQAYQSDIRKEVFPNITEPNHPLNSANPADAALAFAGAGDIQPIGKLAGAAADELPRLMGQLEKYAPEVRQGIEDFVRTQSQAGRTPREIGDTVRRWIDENPPVTRRTSAPVDTEPGGLIRSIANESSGPALPQPGQMRFPEDAPLYGESVPLSPDIDPIRAREIPKGVQPGQKALPGVAAETGTLAEKAMAVRYGSMLSSWYTHAQNIAGNTGQVFTRPARLTAAGYPGEAGAAVRGYMQGIPDGVAAFWDTFKTGARDASKVEEGAAHPFGTGKVGAAVEFPTRVLQATDDFFKSIVYSGTIRSEATRLAKGDQATFQELLKSPTSSMEREAQQQARLATYTEDPGRIVNKILNFQRGLNPGEKAGHQFRGTVHPDTVEHSAPRRALHNAAGDRPSQSGSGCIAW